MCVSLSVCVAILRVKVEGGPDSLGPFGSVCLNAKALVAGPGFTDFGESLPRDALLQSST